MNLPITKLPMTFYLWQCAGCPVDHVRNLKDVWPTSPHGKSREDHAPSAIRAVKPTKRRRHR